MSLIEKWDKFTKQYLHHPFDDIVFKYRPRKYGAYELRFATNKNLLKGAIVSFTFFITIFLGSFTYLTLCSEPEEKYQFTEFVGFDANVTNFSLPKGDPNADKAKPTTKKAEGGKVQKKSQKTKNAPPVVTNKNIDIVKKDNKNSDNQKPNSDKDSTIGKAKDNKSPVDSAAIGKGLGNDSTQFGIENGTNAEPIGGMAEFAIYISKHIVYPPQLKNTKTGGTIHVYFVVDTNGVVNEARVIRGLNAYLDAEALRVVKNSPKWKPAMRGLIKVPDPHIVPIKINAP